MIQLEQISNHELNLLGDRFVIRNIRSGLGITFEQYLVDPDRFDRQADRLRLRLDAAGNIEIIGDSHRRNGRVFRYLPRPRRDISEAAMITEVLKGRG